jgi:hypothetical protein
MPNTIETYTNMIIDLIPFAETKESRDSLNQLIEIFKNKFKKEPNLIKYTFEISKAIYKFKSNFYEF